MGHGVEDIKRTPLVTSTTEVVIGTRARDPVRMVSMVR